MPLADSHSSCSSCPSQLRPSDWFHPIVAGLISVIVNYGGTFILVFQAAQIAGLSAELTASWVWSVSIGVGITGILLSWHTREPIITAWSTPAAAFLVTALADTPYSDAVGAYLISAAGFVVLGLSRCFDKVIWLIPSGIASGLLAGILLQFGIKAFGGMSVDPLLAGLLIAAYVVLKRVTARYAVVGILGIGLVFLLAQGRVDLSGLSLKLATPIFTAPSFSVNALLSIGLPLFLITLTGQYMPGMLVLRNDGFKTSANPIVTLTGLGSLLIAPFGSHAFNIAAITAAICTGPEAHATPSKRWIAGIAAGVFYILVGVFGVTLAAVFMAFPATFISTLAGLALLGTIGSSLATALSDTKTREASLITFLAATANITLLGIGGAFWGLLVGLLSYAMLNGRFPRREQKPEVSLPPCPRNCGNPRKNQIMQTHTRPNAHKKPASVALDDLPIGEALPDWKPRPRPTRVILTGRYCRLEPLNAVRHTDALFAAYAQAADTARDWTYLSVGPFADAQSFRAYIERISAQSDPLHFAVVDRASGQALGTLSLMNQRPEHGVVEVGFVVFSHALQRSRLATETQFLLMRYVFDELGYRRYEWKCDSLHQRSRNAALRLGFHYEGTFRQAIVYKQRSRDTAWFSTIDKDWPHVKAALSEWLRPENFDTNGEQITRLQEIRESPKQ